MPRKLLFACALLCLAMSYSCSLIPSATDYSLRGMVVKKVRRPLTVDLHETPMPAAAEAENGDGEGKEGGDAAKKGRIIKIKEPFTSAGVYVELNSTAIGDVAKKHGLTKLYFADIEVFSLLGVWSTTTLYLYGE